MTRTARNQFKRLQITAPKPDLSAVVECFVGGDLPESEGKQVTPQVQGFVHFVLEMYKRLHLSLDYERGLSLRVLSPAGGWVLGS